MQELPDGHLYGGRMDGLLPDRVQDGSDQLPDGLLIQPLDGEQELFLLGDGEGDAFISRLAGGMKHPFCGSVACRKLG
ncbi:hypothetical protein D3C86_2169940 [compost metagenome]